MLAYYSWCAALGSVYAPAALLAGLHGKHVRFARRIHGYYRDTSALAIVATHNAVHHSAERGCLGKGALDHARLSLLHLVASCLSADTNSMC